MTKYTLISVHIQYFTIILQFIRQLWNVILIKLGKTTTPSPSPPNKNKEYADKMKNEFLTGKWSKIQNPNENIANDIYEMKQYEFILSDENNELEKQWSLRVLYETMPTGNIIMTYDIFRQRFNYWSDSIVPYYLLNAVAMKFVSIYRCRDFFIDEYVLEKPSPLANMGDVRPKRYNTNSNIKTSGKKTDKIIGLANVRASKEKQKTNMFSHKGKFSDFHLFQKKDNRKKEPVNHAQLSFSEFKKMQQLANNSQSNHDEDLEITESSLKQVLDSLHMEDEERCSMDTEDYNIDPAM